MAVEGEVASDVGVWLDGLRLKNKTATIATITTKGLTYFWFVILFILG